MKLRLFPALTLFAVLLGCAGGTAEEKPAPKAAPVNGDCPMYGITPSHNMVNTAAKGIPTEWEAKQDGKNIKWVTEIAKNGDRCLPPAVASGKIFVPTNNDIAADPKIKGQKAVLRCLDEKTGKYLWQIAHDLPASLVGAGGGTEGLFSTPFVEGDRLYYVTPGAEVICASITEKGKIEWSVDLVAKFKVTLFASAFCSPVVVGDLVYVVTGNGRDFSASDKPPPEPEAPSFVAIDKKDGKVVWQDNTPGDKIMEGSWSSPLYVEVKGQGQVIFPGGDGWLYAFATGREKKLLWKFDCNPKGSKFAPGGKGNRNYFINPTVHGERLYTATGQQPDNGPGVGHLWCVDITKTGDLSEELAPGKPNPKSGVKWHFGGPAPKGSEREYFFGRSISGFAIHDGLLYAAELEGYLHCLDAESGKEYWQDDLKGGIWASPLWVDGKVYMPDESGTVHIYQHGKEKKALATIDMEDAVKAAPVVANGVLYIMTTKRLFAISGK